MQKIIVAKYSIIEGLAFDTVKANGIYVPKQKPQKIKTALLNSNKTNKKVRFNRSAGHTSSKKSNTAPVHIVLTIIEQQEITTNYLFEQKTSHNRKYYDKKATLELKKLRQGKILMQNAFLHQEEK